MNGDQKTSAAPLFIGLDLTDPFAKAKKPPQRALLDAALVCRFDTWPHDVGGHGIVPTEAEGTPFVLAIDGPQGLAAMCDRPTRVCDHVLTTAGKCPYELPVIDPKPYKPYAGFVRGSVLLFYQLAMSGRFRLLGLAPTPNPNLIEVYPGAAWRTLKSGWLKKTTPAGRMERLASLQERGIRFPTDALPSHDQLDAALAAYIAYLFATGATDCCGEPPFVADSVLREGYIVQPRPKVVMQ